MKIKRFLTGIIGFPIVALLLIFGNNYIFSILCFLISIVGMNEYTNCVSKKVHPIKWISFLSTLFVGIIALIPTLYLNYIIQFGIPVLLLILFLHVIISNMKISFEDITYTLIGILYIVGLISFLPLTYSYNGNIPGKVLIWFILFSAWGTDTWAYLVGMKIGKTKFSKVSPNKSIEGCIAGVIGAVAMTVLFAFALNYYLKLGISYFTIGIISAVLSLIGQIGDFSASVIKRTFDVKDFSEIFPGHGGMLDRIDSVIFIAPFAYLLLTLFL